jgi:hypothetical protein
VTRILVSSFMLAISGAIVAGLTVVIGVDRTDLVLDAYLVLVGAIVALAAARIARQAFPAPRRIVPTVLTPSPRPYALPESLAIAEDEVALAQADQFNLHYRLRPVLVDIAAAGLASDAGIDLERDPELARERLSPETWEIVRPDRSRPERAAARGISSRELTAAVTDLERILPS